MQVKLGSWFWISLTALALTLVFSPLQAGEKDSSKNKVAVVNGSVITQGQLDNLMHIVKKQLSSMGKPVTGSQLSEIKKKTLERLINHELLYQESKKKGIKVDEAALDEKFKKQFSDESKIKDILSRMNMTEAELKSQFKRDIIIRKFIDKEIIQKVTVSDKEVKGYYDDNPNFFKQPEQVQASHILIKVDSRADKSQKAEARKTLEKIQQKLKKGEDFSTLAKEYSQCPSSAKGGDLGYFRRGQMVKPFEDTAFSLKQGEVSDIVRTRFGYHLIKVISKKPERTIPYNEVKDKIKQRLKGKKFQEELRLYIAKLRERAKVEKFSVENPS